MEDSDGARKAVMVLMFVYSGKVRTVRVNSGRDLQLARIGLIDMAIGPL